MSLFSVLVQKVKIAFNKNDHGFFATQRCGGEAFSFFQL